MIFWSDSSAEGTTTPGAGFPGSTIGETLLAAVTAVGICSRADAGTGTEADACFSADPAGVVAAVFLSKATAGAASASLGVSVAGGRMAVKTLSGAELQTSGAGPAAFTAMAASIREA